MDDPRGDPRPSLQLSLALALPGLPDIRRLRLVNTYAQGWGLYSSPRQRMGMSAADMRVNTPAAPMDIASEVDRYISHPAQALSHMAGRLEIERLRLAASRELGPSFDVRGFHDAVLGSGALPLSVLGEVIDAWVETQWSPQRR